MSAADRRRLTSGQLVALDLLRQHGTVLIGGRTGYPNGRPRIAFQTAAALAEHGLVSITDGYRVRLLEAAG